VELKMNIKQIVPAAPEILREAIIVIAGAALAAAIVGQMPSVRAWIKKQWDGAPWQE